MPQQTFDSLLTVLYPQKCDLCENSVERSANGVVCERCWQETRIFSEDENLCGKCGRLLNEKRSGIKSNCQQCSEHFYENARAPGIYEKALAASILNLKREPHLCNRAQELFLHTCSDPIFHEVSLITPVPLSKTRLLERGYNQAQILAESASKHTGIEMDSMSLIRTKHAKVHRAGMDIKARKMSVEKSFEVKRNKKIAGENILLVDDVLTSGATVSSCAKVLKKAGASKVFVLTLARAA